MTEQNPQTPRKLGWRTQSYLIWTGIGMLFGALSGYLYNRAAEEYAARNGGKPPAPGTLEIMGLAVAVLAVIRQITELGKPDDRKK